VAGIRLLDENRRKGNKSPHREGKMTSVSVSQALATGSRTKNSSTTQPSNSEETVERDPRVKLMQTTVEVSALPDDMQLKIIDIATRAIEQYVLVPTQKPWRNDEWKLLEREVERTNMREISQYIKKAVEAEYGPTWHVIYGRSFATYVTHERMNFIHFTVDGAQCVVWKHGH
jgi:hypothetical protein